MQVHRNIRAFHGVAEDALWVINTQDYDERAIFHFEPNIFHPNVRIFMTAMGRRPGDQGHSVVLHEFQSGEDFDIYPHHYDFPISHLYVYALLEWEKEKEIGQSTHYFVGKGDGEPGGVKGDAAVLLELELLARNPDTRKLKKHEGNTVFLPFPNINELSVSRHFQGIVLLDQKAMRFSFEKPVTGRPAVQKNTSIHVINNSAVGQSPLLSVMQTEDDDGYLPKEKITNQVCILAAFIHPEIDENDKDCLVFQLGDPEKDGTIKLQTV